MEKPHILSCRRRRVLSSLHLKRLSPRLTAAAFLMVGLMTLVGGCRKASEPEEREADPGLEKKVEPAPAPGAEPVAQTAPAPAQAPEPEAAKGKGAAKGAAALNNAAANAFRNAVNEPPAGWTGNVFELSYNYPTEKPAVPEGGYPWEAFDFKTQPGEYMQAVLDYARKDLESVDWDPTKLDNPNWFHAPWMAQGPPTGNGREFIRGMTKERSSRTGELSPDQTNNYISNYAVGFYNDIGGWTFGKVWADPGKPDITNGTPNFENGAMAIKLLFTAADPAVPGDGVPYLKGSKEWQASIAPYQSSDRVPETLRLLQVDIAVRDLRNDSVTGWLLGTFVYNGDKPGETPMDRLTPVGLMWGDSPGVKPGDGEPSEQWINADVGTYQHLGWAGRLNGPVDNPASSCMSCHGGGGETPTVSSMIPSGTDEEKLAWFTNIKAGTAKDEGSISLDYSLQMAVALQNWKAWKAATDGPGVGALSTTVKEFQVDRGEEPRE